MKISGYTNGSPLNNKLKPFCKHPCLPAPRPPHSASQHTLAYNVESRAGWLQTLLELLPEVLADRHTDSTKVHQRHWSASKQQITIQRGTKAKTRKIRLLDLSDVPDKGTSVARWWNITYAHPRIHTHKILQQKKWRSFDLLIRVFYDRTPYSRRRLEYDLCESRFSCDLWTQANNTACKEGKVTAQAIKTPSEIRSASCFIKKTHKGITESAITFPSSCNLWTHQMEGQCPKWVVYKLLLLCIFGVTVWLTSYALTLMAWSEV